MGRLRTAAWIVSLTLIVAGCYGGASAPGGTTAQQPGVVASPTRGADSSHAGPSPTIGYCGMDPEPVPCVDRPDGQPGPTSMGTAYALAGTCATKFSPDRCQALALEAATQLGVGFDQILAVDVVPNPSPGDIDHVYARTFLEVEVEGRARQAVVVGCPGISAAYRPACMPQPTVTLGSPGGAYTDVPVDATPFPQLDEDAVAAAVPLMIPSLELAVDSVGPHSILLGRAALPNGRLTETRYGLADPWPSDVLFDGGMQMVVKPTAGGAPLENLYQHGWHPGTEDVEATLTFDVVWFRPGATFTITDVVVR